MAASRNLPNEILLAIADKADISTWKALSRTCRLFLAPSRRKLFERVSVRVCPKYLSRAAKVLAKPHIKRHVRWLVLVSSNTDGVFTWGPEDYTDSIERPQMGFRNSPFRFGVTKPSMSEQAKCLVAPLASTLCGLTLRCSQKIHKHPKDHIDIFTMGRAVLSAVRCPSLVSIHIDTDEIATSNPLWDMYEFEGFGSARVTAAYIENIDQMEDLDMRFFTQYPMAFDAVLGNPPPISSRLRSIKLKNTRAYIQYHWPLTVNTLVSLIFHGIEIRGDFSALLRMDNHILKRIDLDSCLRITPQNEEWCEIFDTFIRLTLTKLRLRCLHYRRRDKRYPLLNMTEHDLAAFKQLQEHAKLHELSDWDIEGAIIDYQNCESNSHKKDGYSIWYADDDGL